MIRRDLREYLVPTTDHVAVDAGIFAHRGWVPKLMPAEM